MISNLKVFGFLLTFCAALTFGEDCVNVDFWNDARQHCVGALRSEDHECFWRCVDDLLKLDNHDNGRLSAQNLDNLWTENVEDEEIVQVMLQANKKCLASLSKFDRPCEESKDFHICLFSDSEVRRIYPRFCNYDIQDVDPLAVEGGESDGSDESDGSNES